MKQGVDSMDERHLRRRLDGQLTSTYLVVRK